MISTNPIRISEVAKQEILETLSTNKIPDVYGLRVGVKGGGHGRRPRPQTSPPRDVCETLLGE